MFMSCLNVVDKSQRSITRNCKSSMLEFRLWSVSWPESDTLVAGLICWEVLRPWATVPCYWVESQLRDSGWPSHILRTTLTTLTSWLLLSTLRYSPPTSRSTLPSFRSILSCLVWEVWSIIIPGVLPSLELCLPCLSTSSVSSSSSSILHHSWWGGNLSHMMMKMIKLLKKRKAKKNQKMRRKIIRVKW